MKRSRFSEEQIIGILREAESGSPIKAVCATHNISTATSHGWKRKFGGMGSVTGVRVQIHSPLFSPVFPRAFAGASSSGSSIRIC